MHYYEGIRKAAVNALFTTIKTFYEMSDPVDWQEGVSLSLSIKHTPGLVLIRALLSRTKSFPSTARSLSLLT
jgi:hypothetical protein